MLAFCAYFVYYASINLKELLAMEDNSPKGRAKGGKKRAEILSPEERKGIAVKAAAARWGEKPIQAIRKGTFKEEFGVDVECYVLDDVNKTAVISQKGMGRAIG